MTIKQIKHFLSIVPVEIYLTIYETNVTNPLSTINDNLGPCETANFPLVRFRNDYWLSKRLIVVIIIIFAIIFGNFNCQFWL